MYIKQIIKSEEMWKRMVIRFFPHSKRPFLSYIYFFFTKKWGELKTTHNLPVSLDYTSVITKTFNRTF